MDLSEVFVPSQVSLEVIQLGIPARSTLGSVHKSQGGKLGPEWKPNPRNNWNQLS